MLKTVLKDYKDADVDYSLIDWHIEMERSWAPVRLGRNYMT